jgi:hypothetical protein
LACETLEAVGSEAWLNVSLESVKEFLRMDCLDMEEAALVRALIKWGIFQLQKDGDDPTDSQELRSKILPGINLIRFASMSHIEFAQLCLEDLASLLSGDEKHLVMMFIITRDWKQMPAEIAPTKLAPRHKPQTVFQLQPMKQEKGSDAGRLKYCLFKLDMKATLVGLEVEGTPSFLKNLSIEVGQYLKPGSSGPLWKFSLDVSEKFFKVTPDVDLAANTWYNLSVFSSIPYTCYYSFPNRRSPITSDGLALYIDTPAFDVNLQKIIFKSNLKNLAS